MKTRSFVTLEVSPATWQEITTKLKVAGYPVEYADGVLDMDGVGLVEGPAPETELAINHPQAGVAHIVVAEDEPHRSLAEYTPVRHMFLE